MGTMDMNLLLERIVTDGDSTIGLLFLDEAFQCFTLEDEYRTTKKYGETRIPSGSYQIRLRTAGRLHEKYKKFGEHVGMLWLQNVPGFEWIYLHIGNDDDDTLGCPLVGDIANASPGDMKLMNSTAAYRKLYGVVAEAARKKSLTITIVDRDL
jgi:hypothetical protein